MKADNLRTIPKVGLHTAMTLLLLLMVQLMGVALGQQKLRHGHPEYQYHVDLLIDQTTDVLKKTATQRNTEDFSSLNLNAWWSPCSTCGCPVPESLCPIVQVFDCLKEVFSGIVHEWDYIHVDGQNLPGHAHHIPCLKGVRKLKESAQFFERFLKKNDMIACSAPDDYCIENYCKGNVDIDEDCDHYTSLFDKRKDGSCLGFSEEFNKPDLRDWKSDKAFSKHFIQGVNPHVIEVVKNLNQIHPDLRNVTTQDSKTVDDLLNEEKLLIADYSALEAIKLNKEYKLYSPQVLFYIDDQKEIDMLAILLRTDKHTDPIKSVVFTKKDAISHPNRYLFAKMHVANADSQDHEFIHHLLLHFVMESISIAHHNHLVGHGHLIGALLEPHMKGTIFINFFARHTLIKEKDSGVEHLFSVGREGAIQLIQNHLRDSYNFSNTFPHVMSQRGFPREKTHIVKHFFYQSDGFELWDILHNYVHLVVNQTYKNDKDVHDDNQLQEFCTEVAATDQGNIPGFPKTIDNKMDLVDILTQIIFTGSVQHQSVNAPQNLYGYAPHRPTLMTKWMPLAEDNSDMTWKDIMEGLPNLSKAKEAFDLFMLISTQSVVTLMDLKMQTELEKIDQSIKDTLHTDLQKLSRKIKKRYHSYQYLDPAKIPCSIDI